MTITSVEICGGIASGKTTLASLMEKDFTPVFENFKKSPFWEAFYCNPGKYIFETEISFILLHYHQIKKALEEKKGGNFVCDFSFLLDLAYAKIGLTGSKLKAFECVLDEIRKDLPKPDLTVYLICDAKTEFKRIRKRARDEESSINIDFLDSLNKALYKEIEKNQETTPVITIDSGKKDFANVESIKDEMLSLIENYLSKY